MTLTIVVLGYVAILAQIVIPYPELFKGSWTNAKGGNGRYKE